MSKRGIRGPLLCIGDLLNDIGEEEEEGRGHSLLREASPSPSSSLLNNLTKLFQEHYDHLNSTLSGTDHSWTSLTLKADKLLSPEFQPSIEQLIHFLPTTRQILMFSATFPVTVKDFKDRYLQNL